jgi:hypothetical protein
MHVDDAEAFIVDFLKAPHNDRDKSNYGYELYLPKVIMAYLKEIEESPEYITLRDMGPRAVELSPIFYEGAWNLCRRGILRPGVRRYGEQATSDGASGNGYSLTELGRNWIEQDTLAPFLASPGRLGQLFGKLSELLGAGFLQRANEAAQCHAVGAYLGCCAMCGAAAESILLAVAISKSRNEESTLATYRSASGRRRITESIVGQARPALADPFRSATELLSYWRDETAHGLASTISEIEAHTALARLLRFAQFACNNWAELIPT